MGAADHASRGSIGTEGGRRGALRRVLTRRALGHWQTSPALASKPRGARYLDRGTTRWNSRAPARQGPSPEERHPVYPQRFNWFESTPRNAPRLPIQTNNHTTSEPHTHVMSNENKFPLKKYIRKKKYTPGCARRDQVHECGGSLQSSGRQPWRRTGFGYCPHPGAHRPLRLRPDGSSQPRAGRPAPHGPGPLHSPHRDPLGIAGTRARDERQPYVPDFAAWDRASLRIGVGIGVGVASGIRGRPKQRTRCSAQLACRYIGEERTHAVA